MSTLEMTYDGMDISSAVPFDAEALVNDIVDSAIINDTEGWVTGWVTGVDSEIINTAMTGYRAQVEEYFTSQHPDATVGDVLGTKTIIAENHPILIGTLPYKMREIGTRMSTIPDEMRHKVRFTVRPDEMNYDAAHIEHSIGLPELAGKKVTLSYSPATAEDEDIINSYLPEPHPDGTPIDPSEFPDELPAYLINMNAELRVEGEVVATGGPYQLGTKQTFHMHFDGPALDPGIVNNCIYAGEYYGIAIDVARISKGMMEKVKARLEATKAKLESGDYEGLTRDDIVGDFLYTTILTYYAEYDSMDYLESTGLRVNNIRVPSQGIFKATVDTYEMFGTPVSVSAGGLMMDVDRNLTLTKAKDGDRDKYLQFMQTSGMNSSSLEHSVPEQLFSTPESPAYGVSAVKAVEIALSQGIPIYTINSQNADTVISKLQLDEATIQEIRNAVNAGNEVTTSQTNINFHGWQGCGYIVYNPITGTGGYMITGQENGGKTIIEQLVVLASFSMSISTNLVTLAFYAIAQAINALLALFPSKVSSKEDEFEDDVELNPINLSAVSSASWKDKINPLKIIEKIYIRSKGEYCYQIAREKDHTYDAGMAACASCAAAEIKAMWQNNVRNVCETKWCEEFSDLCKEGEGK